MIRKATWIVLFSSFLSGITHAQDKKTNYEWGLNLGFMVYQGDLSNGRFGSFRTEKLFFDLHATKLLGDFFSARLNVSMGKLKGDDSKYKDPEYKRHRNFNFSSPVYELSARVLWDPTGKNYSIKGIAPYIFAGAGFSFLNIKNDWSQHDKDYFPVNADVLTQLSADSAHGVPGTIPVFPLGGGLKYFISPTWALNAEVSYRVTSTDYLDGFSKSANPDFKDSYLSYSVGIIYRPGKKDPLSCPTTKY